MAPAGESAATGSFSCHKKLQQTKLQQIRYRYSSIEDVLPRLALWWRPRRIPDTHF
jgi:hypothetical protein